MNKITDEGIRTEIEKSIIPTSHTKWLHAWETVDMPSDEKLEEEKGKLTKGEKAMYEDGSSHELIKAYIEGGQQTTSTQQQDQGVIS